MVNQSKYFSTTDNQTKYGDKKPYNNIPPAAAEELAPILVTKEVQKDPALIDDNIETWRIHGHRIPVAFAPIKAGILDGWMPFFWTQVRTYIATGGTSEFLNENGHEDDLSYDKFLEDAASDDENSKGFDPGQTASPEDTVLLGIIIDELINDVRAINPKYGRILELLGKNRTKWQILEELHLGKTQGYADIKATQKLAHDLYNRD